MKWADQLIKLSNFEVELLQKRLSEIVERRVLAEMKLAVLVAEGEAELQRAREDAQAGWYHAGFAQGLKVRKAAVQLEIDQAMAEEEGARDALAEAGGQVLEWAVHPEGSANAIASADVVIDGSSASAAREVCERTRKERWKRSPLVPESFPWISRAGWILTQAMQARLTSPRTSPSRSPRQSCA